MTENTSDYGTTCDSTEYFILENAVRNVKNVSGLTCEIGVREGGSSLLIMKILKETNQNKIHIGIDPFGNINYKCNEYNVVKYDYTNKMKVKMLKNLYDYCFHEDMEFIYFPLEDSDFFEKFKNGLPIYNESKKIVDEYSLVFFDGPHTIEIVKNEFDFFKEKIPFGGMIVFDDLDYYPHMAKLNDYIKNCGFSIFEKGLKKMSYVKTGKKSYSQLGQDLEVLKIYNNKKKGFFIEIGANDGITLSNTYLLEKNYEWKGICCEPNPHIFETLVKNRPESICCSEAVYGESGLKIEFDIAMNSNLFSGISQHIDNKKRVDENKTTIQVETISLSDLLQRFNAPAFIEYISLDTEGSELEILKNFDFEKYTFGLIDVEHNYVEPRRSEIRELLLSKGYVYKGENKWDDMYIFKELSFVSQ